MQIATWTGLGSGVVSDPFVLDVSNFNLTLPFNIKLVNNYDGFKPEISYFKFSNQETIYMLAVIVKTPELMYYYRTSNALEYTMLLTDAVDFTDGSFILSVKDGIHYIVKQQIFGEVESSGSTSTDILFVDSETIKVIESISPTTGERIVTHSLKVSETEDNLLEIVEDGVFVKRDNTKVNVEVYDSDKEIIDNKLSDLETDISDSKNEINTLEEKVIQNELDIDSLDLRKVDKVASKGLSTNDYDNTEKGKVEGLYNDNYFKGASMTEDTYVITFLRRDDSTVEIDLPLESIVVDGEYDKESQSVILTLDNGNKITIPIGDIIDGLMTAPSVQQGELSNKTLTYGGTFKVLYIGVDGTIATRTMTMPSQYVLPSDVVRDSDLESTVEELELIIDGKVDKITGKGLSTNDYTTAEKNKLASIENGAQVNVLDGVKLNGVDVAITSKKSNIVVSKSTVGLGNVDNTSDLNKPLSTATINALALKVNASGNQDISGAKNFIGTLLFNGEEVATMEDLSTVFVYKGSVETFGDLPTTNQKVGDTWNVNDTGNNYAWSGTAWDDLTGIIDLSNYYTKAQVNTLLDGKVNVVALTVESLQTDLEDVLQRLDVLEENKVEVTEGVVW